jgi:hypothetical protein
MARELLKLLNEYTFNLRIPQQHRTCTKRVKVERFSVVKCHVDYHEQCRGLYVACWYRHAVTPRGPTIVYKHFYTAATGWQSLNNLSERGGP